MLKNCIECNEKVSSDADACPYCGYRIRGREHLVNCKNCNNDIIPINNPHDTISRYCPICNKPVNNKGCRFVAHAFIAIIFLLVFSLVGAVIFTSFKN